MSPAPLPAVLVVDDDQTIRLLLRSVFERDGRFGEVEVVNGGVDAVERAGITKPGVIILDLGMWELSGYEALPLLKARCPDAAIVIYSGSVRPADRDEAVTRGADEVIDKSVPAVDLPGLAFAALAAKRQR
jgi:CheY-like chemotaxis protein